MRPSFLASNAHTVLGSGGQAFCSPTAAPWQGKYTHCCSSLLRLGRHPIPASHLPKPQTPQCCPFSSSEPTPHTLPSPENPVPGAPLLGVMTPALRPAPRSHWACPSRALTALAMGWEGEGTPGSVRGSGAASLRGRAQASPAPSDYHIDPQTRWVLNLCAVDLLLCQRE